MECLGRQVPLFPAPLCWLWPPGTPKIGGDPLLQGARTPRILDSMGPREWAWGLLIKEDLSYRDTAPSPGIWGPPHTPGDIVWSPPTYFPKVRTNPKANLFSTLRKAFLKPSSSHVLPLPLAFYSSPLPSNEV